LFGALRPLIAWLLTRSASEPAGVFLAMLLIGTFASAYATAYLGVHPVFGAFLFGACLPRDDRLLHSLIERIEHVAVLVLMPVFFALAGLNTSADAFSGAGAGHMSLVLLGAVAGKIIGGSVGARIAGERWRPALAIGSLMNARGLMELIVMKVGLDAGLIGKPLFTMLLVMAIVTTVMTGPLLNLFARGQRESSRIAGLS
jgi:Kef-type K+ transport system membrane component KefB